MRPPFEPDIDEVVEAIRRCPRYLPTPCLSEPDGLCIKDERQRFGLGSFKALGGVYAVLQLALDGRPLINLPQNSALRFVCASAGNHGLAVAYGAQLIGATCRVHLASTVPDSFVHALERLDAEVVHSHESYEASQQAAAEDAQTSGFVLVADSVDDEEWRSAYLVMAGYTAIVDELAQQFVHEWPEWVFVQAGVGGLAAALAFGIAERWPQQPQLVIVEPAQAACLAASHERGAPTTVTGPPTNMARLDCKTPSLAAVEILANMSVQYCAVTDEAARSAVQRLAGRGVLTTPSGAAGFAGWLQLESPKRALVFVTEKPV